jgi:hypothetical protein
MLYALITLLYYGMLAYQTYKVVVEQCLSAGSLPGHNMAFSVVDRLCDKIKGKGHGVYMDWWFARPKIFDCLWACKTKAQ